MVVHQVDNLHIRNEYIAYLVNVSALTSIPFYFFWGRYLDRHGPLKAVKLSMFLAVMVPVVYLFAHDWKVLILASIMSGISASGIDLSYLNSILQFARNDRIPQYQSAHSFLFGVRGTMAPFLGGTLVSLSDSYLKPDGWYGQTFVIPVFFCAITLMLIGILLQKTKYAPDGVRGGVTP
jgi:MFS family permease